MIADIKEPQGCPYQAQVDKGFGLLKFSEELEEEFQGANFADKLIQVRQTVSAVAVFVLVVLVADFLLTGSRFSRPVVPVQGAVSLILLGFMFWLASGKQCSRRALTVTGMLLGLHFGYFNLLLNIYYPPVSGVIPPDLWYVCGTFLIFFCFGLTFRMALVQALLLLSGYVSWLLGTSVDSMVSFYPLMFLLMSGVFSAYALYKIEYNQRSLFLQSKILHYFSEHDQLTGLLNRRAMKDLLRRVWAHCVRERLPLTLAVIGIDCFPDYRRRYGQQEADRCLIRVAGLLENCIQRPLDFVASYSSEEFVLVLPGCNQENARKLLDRLRTELDALGIEHAGYSEAGRITLSIGLVSDLPDNMNADPDTLLQKGDAAAFEAGRNGGNTVVAWQL